MFSGKIRHVAIRSGFYTLDFYKVWRLLIALWCKTLLKQISLLLLSFGNKYISTPRRAGKKIQLLDPILQFSHCISKLRNLKVGLPFLAKITSPWPKYYQSPLEDIFEKNFLVITFLYLSTRVHHIYNKTKLHLSEKIFFFRFLSTVIETLFFVRKCLFVELQHWMIINHLIFRLQLFADRV